MNHIGCLKLEPGKTADNDKAIAEWKEAMTAISAATNVNVKLSGISYTYSVRLGCQHAVVLPPPVN